MDERTTGQPIDPKTNQNESVNKKIRSFVEVSFFINCPEGGHAQVS